MIAIIVIAIVIEAVILVSTSSFDCDSLGPAAADSLL